MILPDEYKDDALQQLQSISIAPQSIVVVMSSPATPTFRSIMLYHRGTGTSYHCLWCYMPLSDDVGDL